MRSSARTLRQLVAVLSCGFAVGLALGCTEDKPEPSPTPTPTAVSYPPVEKPAVVWTPGPPHGPWEANPWVKAYREYRYEDAVAWNARNFTDPRLSELAEDDEIGISASVAVHNIDDDDGYPVQPGPLPFTVVGVAEAPDGITATVSVCQYQGWSIDYTTTVSDPEVVAYTYVLELDGAGHRRVTVTAPTAGVNFDCDGVAIAEGRFDPAPVPEPPHTYSPDDVVMRPEHKTP